MFQVKRVERGAELLRLATNQGHLVFKATAKVEWVVVDENGTPKLSEYNGKIQISTFNRKATAQQEADFLNSQI